MTEKFLQDRRIEPMLGTPPTYFLACAAQQVSRLLPGGPGHSQGADVAEGMDDGVLKGLRAILRVTQGARVASVRVRRAAIIAPRKGRRYVVCA